MFINLHPCCHPNDAGKDGKKFNNFEIHLMYLSLKEYLTRNKYDAQQAYMC